MLGRSPGALVFEPERHEAQRSHVESRRFDLAGQVWVTCVAPLFARTHHHDLAGNDIPEATTRAQRDDTIAAQEPATRRVLRDGQHDKLDWAAEVDVGRRYLVLAPTEGRSCDIARQRIEAHPLPVGVKVTDPARACRKYDFRCRRDMLGAVIAPAPRRQPAPLVSIVFERDNRDGFADDEPVARHPDAGLESLPKSPELLVVAVRIDRDLLDELIQIGPVRGIAVELLLHPSLRCRAFQRALARSRKDCLSLGPATAILIGCSVQ